MTKIALFDYDGTLIDNISCTSFKEGETFDWEKFMINSMDKCTFQSTWELMHEYQAKGIVCIICTARPDVFDALTYQDIIKRNLGEDMVVLRDEKLWRDELEALEGVTDENDIRRIAHEHHALYRSLIIDDLEEHFGAGCILYAVDDQTKNLDTFAARGIECKLVTDGIISDYATEGGDGS
ncbi:HAD-like domain protein [Vibrio phage 3.058.O._10N.286.46.B8]|nr:HAD-like domain protein [Vibrio phage 2.058.O._10N.286.46.B8]AUS03108.1 HAD-like domain protein [Vibrio phage 3.058.O._10N.286.46.B8]